MMRVTITAILFLILHMPVWAQSLHVGYPGLQDLLRREQVDGNEQIESSFTILPQDISAFDSSQYVSQWSPVKKLHSFDKLDVDINFLNPTLRTEFNSHHPYYSNNGAIQPAKGLSSIWSLGLSVKQKFISIQFRPEFVLSQNRDYNGFPENFEGLILSRRYEFWNRIDEPENFGTTPKAFWTPGQSHVLLTYGAVGLGVSSENLWWGPGKRNSLLMTNNARGFEHLTFRSIKPLSTFIGNFEWQIVAGRLEASGYSLPYPDATFRGNRLYAPKGTEPRYLNAGVITYHPKWIKGLHLGIARSFQMYSSFARETETYLPLFLNLFRDNDGNRDEGEIDQLISGFARWHWEKADMEMYLEFGRNDASLNFRDLLISPRHSRAYVFGFSKLFEIGKNQFELNYEHTEMSQTINRILIDAESWYHHSSVRHGYTQYGEVLGAGIGPGSDMDHFNLSYINGARKIGFLFERLSHQNDFYYRAWDDINDFRRFWVDYTLGTNATWNFGPVLLDGQMLFIRSLNYQWEVNDPRVRQFSGGRDLWNFSFSLNASYLF